MEALTGVRPSAPGTSWIERPGWLQCVLPGGVTVYQNTVFLSVFPDAATSAEVDLGIDEAIGEYRRRGLKFRWIVGPWTRPADLPERLLAKGLRFGRAVYGMVRQSAFPEAAPRDPRLTVERIGEEGAAEWARTYGKVWGLPAAAAASTERSVRGTVAEGGRAHFLARFDGIPAGIGSLAFLGRSGYLFDSGVIPEYRRKGVFRALVECRGQEASSRGLEILTLFAFGDTSFPLLRKMGFETVLESPQYFWEPPT